MTTPHILLRFVTNHTAITTSGVERRYSAGERYSVPEPQARDACAAGAAHPEGSPSEQDAAMGEAFAANDIVIHELYALYSAAVAAKAKAEADARAAAESAS